MLGIVKGSLVVDNKDHIVRYGKMLGIVKDSLVVDNIGHIVSDNT